MAGSDLAELLQRIAEIERKLDNAVRHGPVAERRKIDGQWLVRARIGGTDEQPMLSPWRPYVQPNGGKSGFNLQVVPAVGEQVTLISPAGDLNQGVFQSFWWSNDNKALSDDPDEVVWQHRDGDAGIRMSWKDGVLTVTQSKQIVFSATEVIRLVGGGSEVEIRQGHVNVVSADIHTVGKTHLGVESKDEEGKKKAVMEGLMIGPRVKVSDKDAVEDPKVAEIMAAIAAAGGGDGGGGE